MKTGACFTCLGYRQGCSSSGCAHAATTPQDVLCQDCLNNPRLIRDPPNLLLCGLNHTKPPIADVVLRMETWINGFSAQNLGTPIIVNFVEAPKPLQKICDKKTNELHPEPKKDESQADKPLNCKTEIIYNTSAGSARPADVKKDKVEETSRESVCYVMQLLYFGDQRVLTFYDSGANQNLVQAKLARDAGFFQFSSNPVAIGVAGGGKIITEHGQFRAIIGPCQGGKNYSLECQAVSQITSQFPLAKLDTIIDEARNNLPSDTIFPAEIGGDEVKLLIGIRQSELAPRLITSLPSGISIFESKVTDIFGSNICFGGPHEIFTEAYRTAGVNFHVSSIQSLQALFTEVASAYTNSPWAFVRDKETALCERTKSLETSVPKTADPELVLEKSSFTVVDTAIAATSIQQQKSSTAGEVELLKPHEEVVKPQEDYCYVKDCEPFDSYLQSPMPVLTKKQQAMAKLRAQSNKLATPAMPPASPLLPKLTESICGHSDTLLVSTEQESPGADAELDSGDPSQPIENGENPNSIMPAKLSPTSPESSLLSNPPTMLTSPTVLTSKVVTTGLLRSVDIKSPARRINPSKLVLSSRHYSQAQFHCTPDLPPPWSDWFGPGLCNQDRLSRGYPPTLCLSSLLRDAQPQPQYAISPFLTPPSSPPDSDSTPPPSGLTTGPTLVHPSASPGGEMWKGPTMEREL
jgi:hypothetical protein